MNTAPVSPPTRQPSFAHRLLGMQRVGVSCLALGLIALLVGCRTTPPPGTLAPRTGDEIVVAGQFVHTGTPIVLWMDPGGYDGYRVERRFSMIEESDWDTSHATNKFLTTPNRYGLRIHPSLTPEELDRVRGGGWDLPLLQKVVDQFVIHYDVCGTSRQCFKVLHDGRGLSVHFLLDADGTIYQTLDVKERAWHATSSNTRSVGIEIANIGAYPVKTPLEKTPLGEWYVKDSNGVVRIVVPKRFGDPGFRQANFVGYPVRSEPVRGVVQGTELQQYDFTPQQYAALIKLTAALCRVLPAIKCDYPRDKEGKLVLRKLPDDELAAYQGVLGHYHLQTNKTDPGPAFQWNLVLDGARQSLGLQPCCASRCVAAGNARMRVLFKKATD